MTVEAIIAGAATVLSFWIPASFAAGGVLALAGVRRKQVRKMDHVSPFGQQPCGDLSELGCLSQSNHLGGDIA